MGIPTDAHLGEASPALSGTVPENRFPPSLGNGALEAVAW